MSQPNTPIFWNWRRAVQLLIAAGVLISANVAASAPSQFKLSAYARRTGWATFGVTLPQGAAKEALQVGTLPTQTDVKVRWADGSIRFAVLSANILRAGTYAISPAAAPNGVFMPVLPQASVTLTINGAPYVAELPNRISDPWLSGPLVAEHRAVLAPGRHSFLRVLFDVRSYYGGGHRVDITVENGLDVAAADKVTYDVVVRVGGRAVFEQLGVTHLYLARWRKVFTTGVRESVVEPDRSAFIQARALPEYLPTVTDPDRSTIPDRYGILRFGDLTVPMDAHGGRPELAPYPDWTAQYLVHKSESAREYMLRHGELAGSWGIHIKEPEGFALISIDHRPSYWLDVRARDNAFDGPKNGLRGRAPPADVAHQPSLAFVPYLLTGDRFFADEIAYWANFCLISTFSAAHARNGAQGLLSYHEVRGIGWSLRNLGDAAAYLPDGDAMKHYFASKVWNNLVDLQRYAMTFQSGKLNTLFPGRRPEDHNSRYAPYMWVSLWEQAYLAWAVDRVIQHGWVSPQFNFGKAGSALRDRIATLQLALFVEPGWPRDRHKQVPYVLAAGTWSGGPGSTVRYFGTFSAMAEATFARVDTNGVPDFARPFGGFYGLEARLLLLICERLGDRRATDALGELMSDVSGSVAMRDDLNRRSGWAIAPNSIAPSGAIP